MEVIMRLLVPTGTSQVRIYDDNLLVKQYKEYLKIRVYMGWRVQSKDRSWKDYKKYLKDTERNEYRIPRKAFGNTITVAGYKLDNLGELRNEMWIRFWAKSVPFQANSMTPLSPFSNYTIPNLRSLNDTTLMNYLIKRWYVRTPKFTNRKIPKFINDQPFSKWDKI